MSISLRYLPEEHAEKGKPPSHARLNVRVPVQWQAPRDMILATGDLLLRREGSEPHEFPEGKELTYLLRFASVLQDRVNRDLQVTMLGCQLGIRDDGALLARFNQPLDWIARGKVEDAIMLYGDLLFEGVGDLTPEVKDIRIYLGRVVRATRSTIDTMFERQYA